MAFVSESHRDMGSHVKKVASGNLGPGEYHNEGHLHRMAMDAIYPRKQVPFNSNEMRQAVDPKPPIKKPMPGKL
jgi:hypothetical protein